MLKKYLTQITQQLKHHKENYGPNHIITARTMEKLAYVLLNLSKYEAAKTYLEKVLKVYKKGLGEGHTDTLHVMFMLGTMLDNNLSMYQEAKQYFEKVIKITKEQGTDKDFLTSLTMHGLGNVLCTLGEYPEAKTYYEKALKTIENGENISEVYPATLHKDLGVLFEKLGEYEKAKDCYQKAIKFYNKNASKHFSEIKKLDNILDRLARKINR